MKIVVKGDSTLAQTMIVWVVTCFHLPNWHFPLGGPHKTFHFSYMKFLCLLKFLFIKVEVSSIFKKKKIQVSTSRIRSRSIGSAVHHFNPYTTEDLLTIDGLIWIYIATTLTLTLTVLSTSVWRMEISVDEDVAAFICQRVNFCNCVLTDRVKEFTKLFGNCVIALAKRLFLHRFCGDTWSYRFPDAPWIIGIVSNLVFNMFPFS